MSTAARWALRILAVLTVALVVFVVVGILLPGTVVVTRSVEIDAPASTIFPYLDDLTAWSEWTPWGDVESRVEGPPRGPGSRRVWDDPQLGAGSLTILGSEAPVTVDYRVDVEDGAIRFDGHLALEEHDGATTVSWTERADLGWNPLLGWTALTMEEGQGEQLQESLDRLKALVESEARPRAAPGLGR